MDAAPVGRARRARTLIQIKAGDRAERIRNTPDLFS
jgi:hypothetical protein